LDVTVGECTTESLPVFASLDDFREHALIDFSNLTKAEIKGKATRLPVVACARSWQNNG
jgi:hypothetical protein